MVTKFQSASILNLTQNGAGEVVTSTTMVSIVCAFAPDAQTQLHQRLCVPVGTTVSQVIESLGWFEAYPQIRGYAVGIFAQKVTWDKVVKAGDRIEIYRPLSIDPIKRRALRRRKIG